MTQSHLNSSTSSLVILALGSLLVSLCAACSKPSTQTPPAITTSNTTEAATVSNDPEPEQDVPVFAPAPEGKVLRHAVFFSFKEESSEEDIQRIVDAFRELPSKIDEIIDFSWGTNNSPEKHDAGFTHCFMVTFDSEEGRATYLPHEDHLAFVEILKPVLDAPRVLDFWAEK